MRNKHWLVSSLLFLLSVTVALGSCKNPAAPVAPDAETASAPTIAALVGTWKMSSTSTDDGASISTQDICKFSADGSFVRESIETSTPSSGSPTTTYTWYKGTIGISGDNLTMATAEVAQGSASEPSSWITVDMKTTSTAALIGNKLYMQGVAKAQGSNTGIVGTWLTETYSKYPTRTTPVEQSEKAIFSFSSEKTFSVKVYESSTSTYPSDPSTSKTGTYVLNSNGSITLTYTGATTSSTFFYKVSGAYLIQGSVGETSVDANVYIKQ